MAALTDAALALAFVNALEQPDPAVQEVLQEKTRRQKKVRQDAKAHQRNVRKGKKSKIHKEG